MASSFDGNNSNGIFSENLDEHVLNSSYFCRFDVAIPLPFRSSVHHIHIVPNSQPGTETSSELIFPLLLPLDRRQSGDSSSESSESMHYIRADNTTDQSTEINISSSDIDLNKEPPNFLLRGTLLEQIASRLCSPKKPRPYAPLQAFFISTFCYILLRLVNTHSKFIYTASIQCR